MSGQRVDLSGLRGKGDGTEKEIHGVLMYIEIFDGFKRNPETGEPDPTRPKSALAHFDTPDGEKKFWWTRYLDKATGAIELWDKYDQSIDLGECAEMRIPLHVWRDADGYQHLTLDNE